MPVKYIDWTRVLSFPASLLSCLGLRATLKDKFPVDLVVTSLSVCTAVTQVLQHSPYFGKSLLP